MMLGRKDDKVKHSIYLVRPDRYIADHEATLSMVAIAKSFGADVTVHARSQLFKLPKYSKRKDPRAHN